jgi:hypothetical protein
MPGKKGNKNALKHGFYAHWFTEDETKNLEHGREDARDEIANLRRFAGRITQRLLKIEPEVYSEADMKCFDTLVNINIAIGTLLRTNALMTGKHSNVEKSIEDAILSMEERWILA